MEHKIIINDLETPDYARRESLNSLRTNLQFCGANTKVIMFTSCTPNEGKSTIAMELARSMTEDNKRVILVDADLRKSVLVGRHKMTTEEKKIYGLTHFLSGQKKLEEVIYETSIENMDMVVSGPIAPNPTGLLGSQLFSDMIIELKERYDIVLIDCPPLGWVIDAAVVAPVCDGAVLVVESNCISYHYLQDVKKQLEVTGVKILGVVLNKVMIGGGRYYNHYGKYGRYSGKYGKYGKYGSKYGYYGKYDKYEQYGEEPKAAEK